VDINGGAGLKSPSGVLLVVAENGGLIKMHTKTYTTWTNMKSRCLNPDNKAYKYYGGRGITICKEWMDFRNFYNDMGDRPEGMSIERINNDGNYEPSNCKWATWKEQANNKRNNIMPGTEEDAGYFGFRVTTEEKANLQMKASELGITLSNFIRLKLREAISK